ncbi:MAG: tRNA uridine(34) 5-carboxymethylaminomethyl modification radical SAM/GNAT enzyme Elp3 [Candidatus Aenigmarchaeota archaeon]|nr:tRNA uridine(34) 5-carboxymethylaminomethyl modification radical SAM/GNAT enzyme Elp3 [Candidatus Aenigmarchaeota archaeon]
MPQKAHRELLEKIKRGEISTHSELEKAKTALAGKYALPNIMKNAELIAYAGKNDFHDAIALLKTKPVRTLSGVANIAIMWLGKNSYSCPFSCIFCPQGEYSPKSYTGVEPTTLRAKRNEYDAFEQVLNRLKQLNGIGHVTDKCELIIMGGTFMAWDKLNRENFIKRAFDAFNGKDSQSLEDAKALNETAKNRVIGLTIETRADYCNDAYINEMLRYGTTRVEIGVQTTDEELQKAVNRGHGCEKNKEAFRRLREAGLKITAHWMPGLTGLTGKVDAMKELELFALLFSDPDYRPDELKIYPTLVIPGTELHKKWKTGEYAPLEKEEMIALLIQMKKTVPPYIRIKRIMRDISEHKAEAGAKTTNLRQLAAERGMKCRCIRCREVGVSGRTPKNIGLLENEYEAGGGQEIFLSFEDKEQNILIGFLRLRIDESSTAKVREVHVYGAQVPIHGEGAYQHKGYGRRLLERAEEIAKERGKVKIAVTSGVGAREYYKKFGYKLDGYYMVKYF